MLPQSLVQPLHAVSKERMVFPRLKETLDVWQQYVTGRKQTSTQPKQLPAFFLTVPAETHT